MWKPDRKQACTMVLQYSIENGLIEQVYMQVKK